MAVGGFVLMVCGPMLGLAFMMARRNDRGMTAVITNPWVHWQYTPEQWKAWVTKELAWERATETQWSWKTALIFDLFCAGLFAWGVLFNGGITGENLRAVRFDGALDADFVLGRSDASWSAQPPTAGSLS
jgi:hypothetical protein